MSISCGQWRAWQRRAAAMDRKAEDLLCDLINALGVEDTITDYADKVKEETETLHDVLGKCAMLAKSPGRRTKAPTQ